MISTEQTRYFYHNDSAHDFDPVLRVLANAKPIGRIEGQLSEQMDREIRGEQ